jgi:outer membrane protein assembly factor BamB
MKTAIFRQTLFCSLSIFSMMFFSSVGAATVYDFEGTTQGWKGINTAYGPWSVTEWASSGTHSLKADVWLYDHATYYLSIIQNQNLSGNRYLKAKVRRSSWGHWAGFTAKIYVKTGDSWQWYDGGLINVTPDGQELVIDLSSVSNLNYVRELGVAFETWGNCWDRASIYVDNVRLESGTEPGSFLWERDGEYLLDNAKNVYLAGQKVSKVNPVNGDPVWSRSTPGNTRVSSAMLLNDNLFVSQDSGTWKLDKNSGNIVWVNSVKGFLYPESPVGHLLETTNTTTQKKITSMNPSNGTIQWQRNFTTESTGFYILYADAMVVVVSTSEINPPNNRVVYVLNVTNGNILWSAQIGVVLAVDASGVYARSNDFYHLTKYNMSTGAQIWTINKYVTTILLKNEYLYLDQHDMSMSQYYFHRINPSNGTILWSKFSGPTTSMLKVLDNGSLVSSSLVEGSGYFASVLDKNNGSILWSTGPQGNVYSKGSDVVAKRFDFATNSTKVSLVNPSNGNAYWTYTFPRDPYPEVDFLYIDDQSVYVFNYFTYSEGVPYDGNIVAINKQNGAKRWQYNFGLSNVTDFITTDTYIYFSTYPFYATTVSLLK